MNTTQVKPKPSFPRDTVLTFSKALAQSKQKLADKQAKKALKIERQRERAKKYGVE